MLTDQELEDATRFHYSRVLWKNPRTRARLLYVWEHADHPQRERFQEQRALVVGLLECADPKVYVDTVVGAGKWSVQTLIDEIPSMIWSLWDESKEKGVRAT